MVGDSVLHQRVEVDGDFVCASRNVEVDRRDFFGIARPWQDRVRGMDFQGGKLENRSCWPVFSGNPKRICQSNSTRLHTNLFMNKSDSPRGLGFVDDEG